MRVMRVAALGDLGRELGRPVLGMGTLDGVHLGHQAVLAQVRRRAAALGATPGALTFARHPLEVVRPEQAPPLITPVPVKLALLQRLGMAAAVVIEFSRPLAELTAEAFVERVLVEGLDVSAVCVGYDFGFGKGRQGTPELLVRLGARHGFEVEVVPPLSLDGLTVSSRLIRSLLAEGRVEEAQRFLGRPYCIAGEVQPGAGRGRELGFATANLRLPEPPPLRDGVYAGRVLVRGDFHDAVMNLGVAPTFGAGERRLEIHIPGWATPLYGERVTAFLTRRLREERRFPDAAALAAQVRADREAAAAAWDAVRDLPWPEWTLQA